DYAELARLGRVSRARISQIANLVLLAPDIQEAVLFLPRTQQGRDPIRLRHLQPIALEPNWQRQRRLWAALLSRTGAATSSMEKGAQIIDRLGRGRCAPSTAILPRVTSSHRAEARAKTGFFSELP